MRRPITPRSVKSGLPPGTPTYVGTHQGGATRFRVVVYDALYVSEHEPQTVEALAVPTDQAGVTWIEMNFQHMPELQWPWAYPLVWIVMIAIAVLMIIFFRRKRWL